jgi:hypothetical protein
MPAVLAGDLPPASKRPITLSVGDAAEQLRSRRLELGELQMIALGVGAESGRPVGRRPWLGAT